jgi:serine protease Do
MSFFDKIRRQKLLSFSLILFTLSIGVVIGTLVSTGVKAAKEQAVAPGATPLVIPPNAAQLSNAFSQLAKQLEPSVVNISSEYAPKAHSQPQMRKRQQPQQPDDEDDDNGMQDFFQRFFGNPGDTPQAGPRKSYSLGSGVVVDKGGYILTNNHVVEKATRVKVKFNGDPTEYEAKVIGTDPATDVAVLKVERSNLAAAKIGNSDGVQVGDWAVAIGSPFGFDETVTAGIISAKSRDLPGDGDQLNNGFQHFLQTDAAINPGNSGGPLLNINGEVIGINTMIASRSGGYQGIGFALPINTAVKIYNQLIKTGRVTRGSIGISFDPLDDKNSEKVKAYGGARGIFVINVQSGGPAEKAGIQSGDIITMLDGKPVTRGEELMDHVADASVGETMKITVLRNGKTESFNVVIGDRNKVFGDRLNGQRSEPSQPGEGTQVKFGMRIQNLNDSMRQNLGYKGPAGVLVSQIEPDSFAEDCGLQPNDIITNINGHPVTSNEDLTRIESTLKSGHAVAFKVMRATGRGQNPEWAPAFPSGTLPTNAQ